MAAAVFLLLTAAPAAAETEGFPTTDVNLRAGPDIAYPVIDLIPAGDPVTIIGCLSDWSWCDVAWYEIRGWVAADYIETVYEFERVYLPAYATLIALPVITFEFNTYWDSYYHERYHERPWYRDRDHWHSYWEEHRHERREHRRADRDRPRDDEIITGSLPDRPRARRGPPPRIGRCETIAGSARRALIANATGRCETIAASATRMCAPIVNAIGRCETIAASARRALIASAIGRCETIAASANDVRSDRQRDRQVRDNRRQREARSDRQRDRQVRDNRRQRDTNVRADRQRDRQVRQDRRQRGAGVRQDRQRNREAQQNRRQRAQQNVRPERRGGGDCRARAGQACR